ncbi:MAG: tetratricopeptide repeat protein [Paludibacter sp.]|nr:tetratricopeptide repeat protein [Paludibacter sp.]
MSKKAAAKHDEFENVEHALTTSEAFIEKYQKQILYGLGVVAIIVIGFLAINNFYVKPRAMEAANEMYKSQMYFSTDSFRLALEGDGFESIGFEAISSDFSLTPSGNLAKAYAGICYYHLGDYNKAISYLSSFDADDDYISIMTVGLMGDCYAELGEPEKAIKFFMKAAESENDVLSPLYLKKAGIVYESKGDSEKALKNYLAIKNNYPMSVENQDIDKYISRLQ